MFSASTLYSYTIDRTKWLTVTFVSAWQIGLPFWTLKKKKLKIDNTKNCSIDFLIF